MTFGQLERNVLHWVPGARRVQPIKWPARVIFGQTEHLDGKHHVYADQAVIYLLDFINVRFCLPRDLFSQPRCQIESKTHCSHPRTLSHAHECVGKESAVCQWYTGTQVIGDDDRALRQTFRVPSSIEEAAALHTR